MSKGVFAIIGKTFVSPAAIKNESSPNERKGVNEPFEVMVTYKGIV